MVKHTAASSFRRRFNSVSTLAYSWLSLIISETAVVFIVDVLITVDAALSRVAEIKCNQYMTSAKCGNEICRSTPSLSSLHTIIAVVKIYVWFYCFHCI